MNMGNYAHGNQPIQHMIYLYNYAGEPWKAQYHLREVMDKLYLPTPEGYCGDEDNGQTSAWYVFSSLGFYPVTPGVDEYVIGSPLVQKAVVNLENGKKIEIKAQDNNKANRYVQSMKVNGKKHSKNYLNYKNLLKGAKIQFTMGSEPATNRGTQPADQPYSFTK
jgi:predicted alpha-1,2-mannosidase